ncbi:GTPase [Micromonospora sp. CPCC 206060]|uniref:GTPase n=1 Tax=Micromonospora sp. CPCC 206060 TaxID=3122406 RepID=UPI002FF303FC
MSGRVPLQRLLDAGLDTAVAYLRTVEPDTAGHLEQARRTGGTRPRVVLVGEPRAGKSSLVNALLGAPDVAPVSPLAGTGTWLEFGWAPTATVRVWLPGHDDPVPAEPVDLPRWVLPDPAADTPPPRRVQVDHPAVLLEYLTVVDTPGGGGWDDTHTTLALRAADDADILLFVTDAAGPLTAPELDFLARAADRVDVVLFALTKVDAHGGWREVLAANRAALRTWAPRFADAPWFPVSARLAGLAATVDGTDAADLSAASGIAAVQRRLVDLTGRVGLLRRANLLRAARAELARLDATAAERIRATDGDPGDGDRFRAQRTELAAQRRSETRQWSLALGTETNRARVDATGALRTALQQVQEEFTGRIERAGRTDLAGLPQEVDRALQAVSVRLSEDLAARFDTVAERALAQLFDPGQRALVLGGVNATLRHVLAGPPVTSAAGTDHVMVALSAGGVAFMAGRGAVAGASALSAGTLLGGSLVVPFAGLGLGLAVGAFVLYRRRVHSDRAQARTWLREVLAEARAAYGDDITRRFTDLQYALTVALDAAVERRLQDLDARIAEVDRAQAAHRSARAAERAAAQAARETVRARLGQVDEVLTRARELTVADGEMT